MADRKPARLSRRKLRGIEASQLSGPRMDVVCDRLDLHEGWRLVTVQTYGLIERSVMRWVPVGDRRSGRVDRIVRDADGSSHHREELRCPECGFNQRVRLDQLSELLDARHAEGRSAVRLSEVAAKL